MNIYWIFFYLINLSTLSFLSAYQSGSIWPSFGGPLNKNNRVTNIKGPTTNAILWNYTTNDVINPSAIIDASDTIYIFNNQNNLYLLTYKNHQLNHKIVGMNSSNSVQTTPAIDSNGNLFTFNDGKSIPEINKISTYNNIDISVYPNPNLDKISGQYNTMTIDSDNNLIFGTVKIKNVPYVENLCAIIQ